MHQGGCAAPLPHCALRAAWAGCGQIANAHESWLERLLSRLWAHCKGTTAALAHLPCQALQAATLPAQHPAPT